MPPDVLSRRFVLRMAAMLEAGLINYKHYYRWADRQIEQLAVPPLWIIEIATIRYRPDAIAAVYRFLSTDTSLDNSEVEDDVDDEHVAALYWRYRWGATSWADFLMSAGSFTDARNGRRCCEYFYYQLNELEDREYLREVEQRQRGEFEAEYAQAIVTIESLFEIFQGYFREFVAQQSPQH